LTNNEIAILIPAFNEEPRLRRVLDIVCGYNKKKRIVVIDDGSKDRTTDSARKYPVEVLQHRHNKGKGAALQTGIDHVKSASFWLFLDADLINLQHEHMDALIDPLVKNPATGMTVGMLQKGGNTSVDLAQSYFSMLNGQRGLADSFVKNLPDLSWARFGVEIFLSKTAQHWNIPVTAPVLEGLTHHMKESKLGLIPGFAYRLQMYKECLYALFNWKKYLNKDVLSKDVLSEDDFSIEL